MIGLIQVVTQANVQVNGEVIGAIDQGILALIGLEKADTETHFDKLLKKIINYRIFPDEQGKSNLSLSDVGGGLLLVPQFTLVAETTKGSRPSYSSGMSPQDGKIVFERCVEYAKTHYPHVAAGRFGAYMQVNLCNDGPMTFYFKV